MIENAPKPKKPAKKRGPKPWVPNDLERLKAKTLAGVGHNVRDIAIYFHKDVKTVRAAFANELPEGRTWLEEQLAVTLATKAFRGNVAAAIFLLKCKFKWRENQRLELTGKDGQPISFSDLSDTAARELLDALRANLGAEGVRSGPDEEEAPSLH